MLWTLEPVLKVKAGRSHYKQKVHSEVVRERANVLNKSMIAIVSEVEICCCDNNCKIL